MIRIHRHAYPRATALAAFLLASWGAAHAVATPQQLASVTLYGDVTIAQDRVDQWGPWEEFEPPAAGPLVFVGNLQLEREPYRPDPDAIGLEQPELVALLCSAGSLCGYGVQGLINGALTEDTPTNLQLVTVDQTVVSGGGQPGASMSIQLDTLPQAGSLTTDPLLLLDNSDTLFGNAGGRSFAWMVLPEDGTPESYNLLLTRYVAGQTDAPPYQQLAGVVGRVTSSAAMAAMRSAAMQATYAGWDQAAPGGVRGAVSMTVDFGAGSFVYNTAGGVQNYQAQGVIRGSGYVATGFTTPNTSGILQGNFIGSNAQGTVGGATVTQGGTTRTTLHVTTQVVPQ